MAEAGDDERFGLSELDIVEATPLLNAWIANSFTSLETASAVTRKALEKLRILGAVTSGLPPTHKALHVFVMALGEGAQTTVSVLQSFVRSHLQISSSLDQINTVDFDLAIVIRSGGSYEDLLTSTRALATIPHLLVDASFHHTISIGPLVVPGISACLRCLTTRLANRWGETTPPAQPKVSESPELLAALALHEILVWQEGLSLLVGKVRQIDTHTWHTATDTLLRTTPCHRCSESEIS
jgi:hypothetical protein